MDQELFSVNAPAQRITALLDKGSLTNSQTQERGSLTYGDGTICGRAVAVIATDRHVAGGSFWNGINCN